MINGVVHTGVSAHYCGSVQHQASSDLRVRSQSPSTIFQHGMPARSDKNDASENAMLASIETVINDLSHLISLDNKTVQNASASNNTGDLAYNDELDSLLISLIEQLLATLQNLVRDDREEENTVATSEAGNTLATGAPSLLIDTRYEDIVTPEDPEHPLEVQLYLLIEFMHKVNDNLQDTGDDRISELIGHLEQEYKEQRYRNRRNNMMTVLIQFLDEYKNR
jgi:hypothetical protein